MQETDKPLAVIGRQRPLGVHLVRQSPDSERRRGLEDFIYGNFASHYGARIRHFMPCLLGFEDAAGQVQVVTGLRAAGRAASLFLERYLDQPIEEVLAARIGQSVVRRDIVEIGNFAAQGPGGARLMITALTDVVGHLGFHWVAFTGTPLLLNSFQRLDLPLTVLGPADPARMGAELADWGSYYDAQPYVAVANVAETHRRLQASGVYQRLGYQPLYQEVAHVACS